MEKIQNVISNSDEIEQLEVSSLPNYRKRRIKLIIDTWVWTFPFAIQLICAGNNKRPYCLILNLLCFRLVFCIDEDSY